MSELGLNSESKVASDSSLCLIKIETVPLTL